MDRFYYINVDGLNDDSLFQTAYARLSENRKMRIDSFVCRKDKNMSLGAGLLLDYALYSFGKREREMIYGVSRNQKPIFANAPGICFNLSHSGNIAVCAVSDSDVGCDVELLTDNKAKIAKRFFTDTEYEDIVSKPTESEQSRTFYRYWVLKESYIKYSGLGLACRLDSFEIRFINDRICAFENGNMLPVSFTEYADIPGYACSVCAKNVFHETRPELVTLKQAVETRL